MEPEPYSSHNIVHSYGPDQPTTLEEPSAELSEPCINPDFLVQDDSLDQPCSTCALPLYMCLHRCADLSSYYATEPYNPYHQSTNNHSSSLFVPRSEIEDVDTSTWPKIEGGDTAVLDEDGYDFSVALPASSLPQEPARYDLFAHDPELGIPKVEITSDDTLVCDQCSMAFHGAYRRGNLARHTRDKHAAPTFKCKVYGCDKDFARMDKLKDHVRNAHKGDVIVDDSGSLNFEGCVTPRRRPPLPAAYDCPETSCSKSFSRYCELVRHQKLHLSRSERPHKCGECNDGFHYPKDLVRHKRKHITTTRETKIYYCKVPGCLNKDGFSRRDNLMRHQKRQHGGLESI